MSITIRDVAREAGVSTATVSRVINGAPYVREEIRKKVERTMKRLGFVPNPKAKSLATGKSRIVVFATAAESAFEDPHKYEILSGIEKSLARYKYQLLFLQIEKDISVLSSLLAAKMMDGLLIHGLEITPALQDLIREGKVPTLIIGKPREEVPFSWIDNNNALAGEAAARCLFHRGRRKFLFFTGHTQDNISASRLDGAVEYLRRHGISVDLDKDVVALDPLPIKAGKAIKALDREGRLRDYDCLVTANNYLAYGAINALKQAGLKIPSEISVLTYDDYPFADFTKPKLTSVSIDVYSLGLLAGRGIIEQIKDPGRVSQSYIALPLLRERASTRYQG